MGDNGPSGLLAKQLHAEPSFGSYLDRMFLFTFYRPEVRPKQPSKMSFSDPENDILEVLSCSAMFSNVQQYAEGSGSASRST